MTIIVVLFGPICNWSQQFYFSLRGFWRYETDVKSCDFMSIIWHPGVTSSLLEPSYLSYCWRIGDKKNSALKFFLVYWGMNVEYFCLKFEYDLSRIIYIFLVRVSKDKNEILCKPKFWYSISHYIYALQFINGFNFLWY